MVDASCEGRLVIDESVSDMRTGSCLTGSVPLDVSVPSAIVVDQRPASLPLMKRTSTVCANSPIPRKRAEHEVVNDQSTGSVEIVCPAKGNKCVQVNAHDLVIGRCQVGKLVMCPLGCSSSIVLGVTSSWRLAKTKINRHCLKRHTCRVRIFGVCDADLM